MHTRKLQESLREVFAKNKDVRKALVATIAERDQLRAENERLREQVKREGLAGANYAAAFLKRAEAAERERDELQALIDMQHERVVEANRLWREAHPGNDLVMPDLGRLIDWLLLRSDEARAHAAAVEAAPEVTP